MTRQLGTITREWIDDHGHPCKERVGGTVECPKCGQEIELLQDTECWAETEPGSGVFEHDGYGPLHGVCCDTLIVDYWEGCFCYDLSGAAS